MPKPIRVLLVDDEKIVRQALRDILTHEFPYVNIVGEAANVPEAVREINRSHPDLIFLDIEMPGYSGLQLLEFFEPTQVTFDIVFVTAFNEYAIQAFKISAFDYLLKPVNTVELKNTLARYTSSVHQQLTTERINLLRSSYHAAEPVSQMAIHSLQGIDFVQFADIIELEASGAYTLIKLTSGEIITASRPLGEFEVLQKLGSFFRVHRSHLINLHHVKKLVGKEDDQIVMRNGSKVPLSRYRRKEFEAAIGRFSI